MTRFDLQSHSTASDGTLEPAGVVRAAADAGVELLALTDHDTVAGVEEALQAGAEAGVRIVPAVELSSVDGAHEELHVLGYGVDHHDGAFEARLADCAPTSSGGSGRWPGGCASSGGSSIPPSSRNAGRRPAARAPAPRARPARPSG